MTHPSTGRAGGKASQVEGAGPRGESRTEAGHEGLPGTSTAFTGGGMGKNSQPTEMLLEHTVRSDGVREEGEGERIFWVTGSFDIILWVTGSFWKDLR